MLIVHLVLIGVKLRVANFIKVRCLDSRTKTKYWGLFNVEVIDSVHEATVQTTVIQVRGLKPVYSSETVDEIYEKIQSVRVQ